MVEHRELKKRKHVSPSFTIKRKVSCGNIYGTIEYNEDCTISRVKFELGKSGSCRASNLAAIGELVSLLFQGNYDPLIIIDRLKNISCGNAYFLEKDSPDNSLSCADTIARVIEEALEILEEKKEKEEKREKEDSKKESTKVKD